MVRSSRIGLCAEVYRSSLAIHKSYQRLPHQTRSGPAAALAEQATRHCPPWLSTRSPIVTSRRSPSSMQECVAVNACYEDGMNNMIMAVCGSKTP